MTEVKSSAEQEVIPEGMGSGNTQSPEASKKEAIDVFKVIHDLLSTGLFQGGQSVNVTISLRFINQLIRENS